MGARVLMHGHDIGEAREHAMQFVREEQLTYINGFDDPAIIAGQGTMGLEILEQVPDLRCHPCSDWRRRIDRRCGARGEVAPASGANHRRAS